MLEFSALDGAILVDKPSGRRRHDVVDAIRRKFGIKKSRPLGTLDPNATGPALIVLVAHEIVERLMGDDKVYEGTINLASDRISTIRW